MTIKYGDSLAVEIRLQILLKYEVDDIRRQSRQKEDKRQILEQRRSNNIACCVQKVVAQSAFAFTRHRKLRLFLSSSKSQPNHGYRHDAKRQAIGNGKRGYPKSVDHRRNDTAGGNAAERRCRTHEIEKAPSLTCIECIANGTPNDDIAKRWSRNQKRRIRQNSRVPRKMDKSKRHGTERRKDEKSQIQLRRRYDAQELEVDERNAHQRQTRQNKEIGDVDFWARR